MAGLDEDEQRWRHHHATRRQRRPTAIPPASAPGNPRRRPFDARRPDPSPSRIVDPPPVMVAGPPPWLIAHPIPAAVCPDPAPITVGPPFHGHVGRPPATSVGAHLHPDTMGRQRRVKIRRS